MRRTREIPSKNESAPRPPGYSWLMAPQHAVAYRSDKRRVVGTVLPVFLAGR
jgi:hypothetical protein